MGVATAEAAATEAGAEASEAAVVAATVAEDSGEEAAEIAVDLAVVAVEETGVALEVVAGAAVAAAGASGATTTRGLLRKSLVGNLLPSRRVLAIQLFVMLPRVARKSMSVATPKLVPCVAWQCDWLSRASDEVAFSSEAHSKLYRPL